MVSALQSAVQSTLQIVVIAAASCVPWVSLPPAATTATLTPPLTGTPLNLPIRTSHRLAFAGQPVSPSPAEPATPPPAEPIPPPSKPDATGRIYIRDRRISFIPPKGFTAMSQAEILRKYPGVRPPQYAFGNPRRSVSVAITIADAEIQPEELPAFKRFMENFMEKSVPGLEWHDRDLLSLNGLTWIRLDFTSKAIDTDIRNDMYLTSWQGKMLGFNFNTTVELATAVRDELVKSRDSIRIQP